MWPGEISARALGVALASWDDDGNEIRGAVGELVLTKPIPSMPIYFWNDPARIRYEDSYFSVYPGVWRHGDWVTVTEDGSVVMHGRSDSTLNRHGVRLGSAEIYQAVAHLPEIEESLIVGVDEERGYWMPLFVVLTPGPTRPRRSGAAGRTGTRCATFSTQVSSSRQPYAANRPT